MLSEPISMVGPDFVKFAESQVEIWSMAQGAVIQHENFGSGEIEAVQIRKGCIPLITIKFCTNSKVSTFNIAVPPTPTFAFLGLTLRSKGRCAIKPRNAPELGR